MRYNASCITASETEPGEKFENVPNVIVIYISEFDLLRGGKTAYHIQKVVKETGEIVDDGLREIYVNTKIDDGTDMGELLQMFNRSEVDNPKFPVFTERMKYLKHSEGGRGRVCTIMEEYAKEYAEEYAKEYAKDKDRDTAERMIRKGKMTLEEIAEYLPSLSIQELRKIEAEIMQLA